MADETSNFLINVETTGNTSGISEVSEALAAIPDVAEESASKTNEALAGIGDIDAGGISKFTAQVDAALTSAADGAKARVAEIKGALAEATTIVPTNADIARQNERARAAVSEQARVPRPAASFINAGLTNAEITEFAGIPTADLESYRTLLGLETEAEQGARGLQSAIQGLQAPLDEFTAEGVVGLRAINSEITFLEKQSALLRQSLVTGRTSAGDPLSDFEKNNISEQIDLNSAQSSVLRTSRKDLLTGSQETATSTTDVTLEERLAQVTALTAEGKNKEAVATAGLGLAEQKLETIRQAGITGTTEELAAIKALTAAQERLAAVQDSQAAAAAKAAEAGGGGIGGFFRGFQGGLGGGDEGQDAESLGNTTAQVAKYLLLYQAFRLVEDGLKQAITQSVDFDRAITDLGNRLDLPRDKATALANSLGSIGAPAGLAPSQSVELGAQFAGAFQGQGSSTQLAQQGSQLGAELTVLGGSAEAAQADLEDLVAATRAFNLTAADTPRVLDAATSAAQNFGLANAQAVLPGLAQIGDLATSAGFSVEQTANTLADLQARTGESSAATAGELQRFFGREGNAAFQEVFANLGINTLQPFNDELSDLSAKFDTLTQKQKDFITAQFGGGRAGVAALALIEDYGNVQEATNKSVSEGGIAQEQYFKRLDDVRGLLEQLKGDLLEIAKDVGTSGIGAGAGVLLEAFKPVLDTVQQLLAVFDSIPAPLREAAFLVGEIALAANLIGKLDLGTRVGNIAGNARSRVGGIGATGPAGTIGDAEAESAAKIEAASTEVVAAETKFADDVFGVGGAKLTAGIDALTSALTRGAEQLDAEGLTGSSGVGRAALNLGAVDVVDAAKTSGLLITDAVGTLATSIKGAASGLLEAVGPLGVALAGAFLIDQTFNATSKVLSAQVSAGGGGTSADDFLNGANAAGNQAVSDRRDSSGFFGATINALLGNQAGRDAAASARSQQLDAALAKQIQTAGAGQTAANANEALVDLQDATDGTNGLTTSLKNLAAVGLTAQQQFDAVSDALSDANKAANGFIAPGQFAKIASVVGANAAQDLSADSTIGSTSVPLTGNIGVPGTSFRVPGTSFLKDALGVGQSFLFKPRANSESNADTLTKSQSTDLSSAVSASIQSFLNSNDPFGDPLTAQQLQQERDQAVQAAVTKLQNDGKNAAQIAKLLPDLKTSIGQAVSAQLASLTSNSNLSVADVADDVTGLTQTAQQAGTDEVTNASLGGAAVGPAGVTGANTTLQDLLQTRAELLKQAVVKTPGGQQVLSQLNQNIAAAQLALQQATTTQIGVDGQLAQSLISPLDKDGTIKANIATLQAELKNTSEVSAREALQAQINQASQQLAAQVTSDINAAYAVGVASDDAVGQAQVALEQALNTQQRDLAQGATGSQVSQDTVAVANAKLASLQAGIAQTVAQQTASARAGDPLAQATTALTTAQETLTGITAGTTAYYTQLATINQAQYALAQAIATDASNQFLLARDTTNPVDTARAALQQALVQQAQDQKRGTGNAAADKVAVENAQEAAIQAVLTQQLSLQETAFNLHQETGQQYLDFLENQKTSLTAQLAATKKGSEGYQQLIDDLNTVNGDILSVSQQYSGQFNLGNIKVPTVYDARVQEANPSAGLGASTNVQNVYFSINGADTNAVKQIISQTLGQQPLSTRGVTTRKVTVS
jgi:hypothetical protein